ncbi:MAG: hypothetical protein AB7O65_00550 [Candidatus Korobacteraceae bacterium]
MESTCYRCGAVVDDSVPFCPQCNAPQIRVAVPAEEDAPDSEPRALQDPPDERDAAATEPFPPGTPGDVQPPATPVTDAHPAQVSVPLGPAAVNWSQAIPGAAIAGAVVALAWAVPYLGFILWMAIIGLAATLLYQRRSPGASLTTGMGARIGALGGLFGFGVFVLLLAVQMLLLRSSGGFRAMMQQVMEQAAAQNTDPRAQEMLQRLLSPEGIALILTMVLVMAFFGFLLFSSLGGVLGAYLSRRRDS